ncbi:hypothetical protein O181_088701 [Austropuccinia psidii MF-1]|uniref:Uncharacterized protein n=1 Tax=Austropuccinia psidii MF-1 TaxID=1389203 RepID=A0A9Q3IS55_9BASI|nr:hypothetical protein [Austropuccinia psidii MF-1]
MWSETREKGEEWKMASKNQRTNLLRQSGVCYAELNRLEYQNPGKHVSLFIMHNWMEGILAHHFCTRWGFQEVAANERNWKRGPLGVVQAWFQKKRKVEGGDSVVEAAWESGYNKSDTGSDMVLDGGETGGFLQQAQGIYFDRN